MPFTDRRRKETMPRVIKKQTRENCLVWASFYRRSGAPGSTVAKGKIRIWLSANSNCAKRVLLMWTREILGSASFKVQKAQAQEDCGLCPVVMTELVSWAG